MSTIKATNNTGRMKEKELYYGGKRTFQIYQSTVKIAKKRAYYEFESQH